MRKRRGWNWALIQKSPYLTIILTHPIRRCPRLPHTPANTNEVAFLVMTQIVSTLPGAYAAPSCVSDPERKVGRDGTKWGQTHGLGVAPFRVILKQIKVDAL